jgi:hypothetical protein
VVYRDNPRITYSIDIGWFVLSKYYSLSDISPAYAAVILLYPSKRQRYITKQWHSDWQKPAIDAVEKLWVDSYQSRPMESVRVGQPDTVRTSQQLLSELDKLRAEMDIVDDNYTDMDSDL